jgi:selenocysteine-specific elongation factor
VDEVAAGDDAALADRQLWAILEFESPVICTEGALFICSKLDTDPTANACRLAFHGHLTAHHATPDYPAVFLPRLRICKPKSRTGIVERVHDEQTVIVRDMFGKDSNFEPFLGQ